MIKWIGGATAAAAVLLGGASLAGNYLQSAPAEAAPSLADAIPVDEAAMSAQPANAAAAAGAPAAQPAAAPKDEPFVVKRILPINGPIKYGEWHWDTKGVPAGPIVITVDLKARVISAFQGGYEIGAAAAMLGTKEYPTPTGTFPILAKQKDNVSEKYGNAPMPFSMFLTRDGVAIHGGHAVENGYASHGCISVPTEFAEHLFAVANKGDKVIITDGKTMGMGDRIL